MKNVIVEYGRKIEILEKKVSDLEKRNENLRECLLENVQFSANLSNITYEMDCLLVKKGQEGMPGPDSSTSTSNIMYGRYKLRTGGLEFPDQEIRELEKS